MNLRGARILIADDQSDVARTLTEPLRAAGAVLRFVDDGEQALEAIRQGGNDLLIVDMKMPPHEWGGLWLLEQLQKREIALPALVLSGEGQQRQTIAAMRYGAKDWISKGKASDELQPTSLLQLQMASEKAVEAMATRGPSPLAYGFARYRRAIGGELQYSEALRILEELVRFVAVVGLASSDPERCGPLLKVQAAALARPSFGSWLTVTRELSENRNASFAFMTLSRHLMPQDKQFQSIVKLRNNQHHGGGDPSPAEREMVFRVIERCAHRFSSTPFAIGSHAQMRLVNDQVKVDVKEYKGAFPPRPAEFQVGEQKFLSSPDPYLFYSDEPPERLDPWLCVIDTDGQYSLGVFDGIAARKPGHVDAGDALLYTDPASGERQKRRSDRLASWGEIERWFALAEA